jgi:polysaccharide deacetylase family protein (PEP-CTERM system associated)
MTIDVEDYYQVSAFESAVGYSKWEDFQSRVMANTYHILHALEDKGIKATFFILGWVAERYPKLIMEIDRRGHSIGCHSYSHRLVYRFSPDEFREDTLRAKNIIEAIIGKRIEGYRAPSYSITRNSLWALPILDELGFSYDSSIFPIYHDRYGIPDAPRFPYKISGTTLTEYPISTALIRGHRIPVTGGGYFRLLPYPFIRYALKRINEIEKKPFIFYLHPWELDPKQPRLKIKNFVSRFRHYINLSENSSKFARLLHDFHFQPINTAAPIFQESA